MTVWAIIPLKSPALGKTRLAGVLEPYKRYELVRSMALHVAHTALQSPHLARICILGTLPAGIDPQIAHITEQGNSLNSSLQMCLHNIDKRECSRLLILHADLPQLTLANITALADLPQNTLGIAPDKNATGTNALSLPTAAAQSSYFHFQFGLDSCALHQAEAARCGISISLIQHPTLAFDVDVPNDLAELKQ